ncbi:hypothetical protein, partial [Paracoccus yeei]|uniref:hypothetical protein n=1 Tax=Paracoccus yeei TaxID=147645 RepID=UPI002432C572
SVAEAGFHALAMTFRPSIARRLGTTRREDRKERPGWSLPAGGFHALHPTARFRPPKVAAFVAMPAQNARGQDSAS